MSPTPRFPSSRSALLGLALAATFGALGSSSALAQERCCASR
jgi:hypothetical protein